MPLRFPIAAITDEFSPNLDTALDAMAGVGMTAAELRVIDGTNIIDCSDADLDRIHGAVAARGMRVISIASPVLKCVLPDAPALDDRVQQDVFGARHTFADQPRLTARALDIAERMGASVIRVFSFWRTVDPPRTFDAVAAALRDLADRALARGLVIGLENEHACNVATAAETARLLTLVDHPALKVIWDPANALVAGEHPYPDGYSRLPASRIVHVHAKDCRVTDHKPTWGPLGEMGIDWKGQLRALVRDGYQGAISLETHWTGPGGDKLQGSTICGRNLGALVADLR
jgi:L-ribulose-5-phosphate 3-epimerase